MLGEAVAIGLGVIAMLLALGVGLSLLICGVLALADWAGTGDADFLLIGLVLGGAGLSIGWIDFSFLLSWVR